MFGYKYENVTQSVNREQRIDFYWPSTEVEFVIQMNVAIFIVFCENYSL